MILPFPRQQPSNTFFKPRIDPKQDPRSTLHLAALNRRRGSSGRANACGELQPRHIKAAHLPDAATYLIAGSLQADRALSVWLVPFSSQYPVDAFAKPFGEKKQCVDGWGALPALYLRKVPLANAEVIRHLLLEHIPPQLPYTRADCHEVGFGFAGCQRCP